MHQLLPVAALAVATQLAADTNRFVFDPASVRLDPRLEITLWAAEPDVVDPVAICWDAAGRAYVAECRDYPYGVGPDGKVGSTIRLLEDTDGDGKPDRATVFARDLSYVTSVTPWRGGILAANAPDITFLKDTNGDGVADVRETVLTGFHQGVSDSLVNSLRYGLDHRVHGANGGNGGSLQSPRRPGETLALGSDDFAFNPDTGEVGRTGQTGGGFGLEFDDFGRVFTTYNINHLQHRFLSRRQADRFPGFAPVELTGSISDHGEMSRIFPISTALTRPNHPEQAGHFSAAGGMGRIASGLFPDELRGSFFVCDVVGNLVHRDVIVPDGAVFHASRAAGESTNEFLASRDNFFRPVGLETGPDGALYLLDLQRDVIEHPDYIPAKVREKMDVRAGQDRGRIYRIAPQGGSRPVKPNLERASDSALVSHLADDNQWTRLTAQRLLLERNSAAAVPRLRALVAESPRAMGRLHGLWTLAGSYALRADEVLRALTDTHPGIRENALLLAEPMVSTQRALADAVLKLTQDSQARVRFVAAQVAGAIREPSTAVALANLWHRDVAETWTRRAILSSLGPDLQVAFAQRVLAEPAAFREGTAPVAGLRELAELFGARAHAQPSDVSWLIGRVASGFAEPVRIAVWDGLASGLERGGANPALTTTANRGLNEQFAHATAGELHALWRLTRALGLPENAYQLEALELARSGATNAARPLPARLADIRLLGLASATTATSQLLALLDAHEPREIQQAALAELRRFREPEVGTALVARWRTIGPANRPAVLNLLLDRRAFQPPLLDALESGSITVGELNLDLEQRRQLLNRGSAETKVRAAKFIGDEEYSNRKTLVEDWLKRLPAQGESKRGQTVFEEACARCHASGAVGKRVGPDLTGVAHRSVEDLLSNILDPNMAINPGFVTYVIELTDGETQEGLIQAETADSVVLLQADELRSVFPRSSIRKLESSGRSLMPEGLEAGRSAQDLRDLIAFLQKAP